MRRWMLAVVTAAEIVATATPMLAQNTPKGYRLENHAWPEVEAILRPETVVVIPLGAAAKEHGRHLRLRTDLTIAEYFTRRVLDASNVAVAPALTYHFYPAFVEYPGSTSLALETARDLTVDVVRSLARFGPRRFYVLNTGVSTTRPLDVAAKALAAEGILMHYTDFAARANAASRGFRQQKGGTHADEVETSLMLHIAPATVDMSRAAHEFDPAAPPGAALTRRRDGQGAYSESGVWGDATVANAQKGALVAEAITAAILSDIEKLRSAVPPQASAPRPPDRPTPRRATPPGTRWLGDCTDADFRRLTQIGPAYSFHWSNGDAERFAGLFASQADIIHPNGDIERTAEVIRVNRLDLFSRREYRNSKHPLNLPMIRCVTPDIAVADGRWSLNSVRDAEGKELPTYEGQVTIVAKRADDGWLIEAYRYTLKPPAQPMPVWLKRPGWPDK
jgi:creatinine amidohydrolase